MKSSDTEFVGGPLDGKVLPITLTSIHTVPKVYRVPVPAHGDTPATTLVYRRAKEYDAKGRWRWRYEYDNGTGGGSGTGAGPGADTGTGIGIAPAEGSDSGPADGSGSGSGSETA